MKVRVSDLVRPSVGVLCGFVFSDDKKPPLLAGVNDTRLASDMKQSARDMAGKQGRIAVIPVSASVGGPAKRIMLAGLGRRKDVTRDVLRHVSGRVAKRARDLKMTEFAVSLAPDIPIEHSAAAAAVTEGAIMSMYQFDRFKGSDDDDDNSDYDSEEDDYDADDDDITSGKDRPDGVTTTATATATEAQLVSDIIFTSENSKQKRDPNLVIVVPKDLSKESSAAVYDAVKKAEVISNGNLFVRSVANLPPNVCSPQTLSDIARGIAKKSRKLKCTVISKNDLAKRGFGGITAVGQGSRNEPKLIILEYAGAGKIQQNRQTSTKARSSSTVTASAGTIVLVGKAVTFDTGGISLKPGANMDEMKFDKCGGCTVLGILKTATDLNLPLNIVGVVPAVENMPGGESYRPGDIIRLYSGKTAEILNTDAEGRLILADALTYAERCYGPREILDFATLTGACIVALGTNVAGMVSNDPDLADVIRESSKRVDEPVWELPLDRDYMDLIKSSVADMKNMGVGRAAGTITAAAFLQNAIINDTPWVHFDIAGVAWKQPASKPRSYKSKGASGFGLRLVMDHLIGMKND